MSSLAEEFAELPYDVPFQVTDGRGPRVPGIPTRLDDGRLEVRVPDLKHQASRLV